MKMYNKNNNNRIRKMKKEWVEENAEYKKDYQKKYQVKNKDKIRKYNNNRIHKTHMINNKEWQSCLEYFNHSCAYCGMTLEEHYKQYNQQLHKEHVIFDGENNLSNCVPSCKNCNSQKWERSLEEWFNSFNPIFTEERLNKIHKWLKEDYKLHIS